MSGALRRIEVMHGVNLDQLGRREAEHYGTVTLSELERVISGFAAELGLSCRYFQTNSRASTSSTCTTRGTWPTASSSTRARGRTTPGRSTMPSRSRRLPAVEVHLSDVDAREEFRRVSVVRDLCIGTVKGKGPDGYRDALALLSQELGAP